MLADQTFDQTCKKQKKPKTNKTNLAEVPLEMAQLQALLQLGAVPLPEVVEGRLRVIQLTQEPAGGRWGRWVSLRTLDGCGRRFNALTRLSLTSARSPGSPPHRKSCCSPGRPGWVL